jgi:BASS family bile acid:Na+ symporter
MFERYSEFEHLFARTQITLFMIGLGTTLHGADFGRILKQPRSLAVGLAFLFVVSPLLALVLAPLFRAEAGIAVGLLLTSLMPAGTLSKVFTYLGKGNSPLAITLTLTSTLGAVVLIPAILRLLASDYVPADFHVPPGLVLPEVGIFLLVPLLVGMAIGRFFPRARHTISKWCVRIGLLAVLLMVIGSLGSGRIHPADYGWRAPLLIIAFCLVIQQLSSVPFYLFRWPRPDRLAVGIEVTMRNMNLALLLKALLFPAEKGQDPIGDGVLFVILFYAAVALVFGILLSLNHRRLYRKDARRQATQADAANSADPERSAVSS